MVSDIFGVLERLLNWGKTFIFVNCHYVIGSFIYIMIFGQLFKFKSNAFPGIWVQNGSMGLLPFTEFLAERKHSWDAVKASWKRFAPVRDALSCTYQD